MFSGDYLFIESTNRNIIILLVIIALLSYTLIMIPPLTPPENPITINKVYPLEEGWNTSLRIKVTNNSTEPVTIRKVILHMCGENITLLPHDINTIPPHTTYTLIFTTYEKCRPKQPEIHGLIVYTTKNCICYTAKIEVPNNNTTTLQT